MINLTRHKPPIPQAVIQVLAFMRKHKLREDDLENYGGAELKSPNERIRKKAFWVEQCWELMASLSVKAADLSSEDAKSGET